MVIVFMYPVFGHFQTEKKEKTAPKAGGTVINIPIQLISSCSTLGELTPLRFRYENEEHILSTIDIDNVLSIKEKQYNGISEIVYTCQAVFGNDVHLFELSYTVNTHRWKIFRLLS